MNYRQLGATGITVSEVGMGCWGIGSDAYGRQDDDVSLGALRAALDAGITFFDTADVYGAGHSEELVGEAVKQWGRDSIVIATKVGSLPHSGREMPHIFTPEHIRQACEASLRRLQTDYIDLYQLHSPPLDTDKARLEFHGAISELDILRVAGKIRAVGVSVKSPEDALTAYPIPAVDVLQVNFNLIDQRILESGLLEMVTTSRGPGLIARTPLAFGFLSSRYQPGHKFQKPHHLAYWPQQQIDTWAKAPSAFAEIKPEAATWTEFALGFILSHASISTVIPGMLTPDEVRSNLGAYIQDAGTIDAAYQIYRSHEFFI